MRRTLPMIAVLVGLLACSASALAARAGHNAPTRKLETAFHVALDLRVHSDNGCYPAPSRIASEIRRQTSVEAGVAANFGSIPRANVVHAISARTSCERAVLALRSGGKVFVLNSARGPVYVKGHIRTSPGKAGRLRGLTLATRSFQLGKPSELLRLDVLCRGRTVPLGGGMTNARPPDADGEAVYPHSYERLGAQGGWHVSVVLFDPSPAVTTSRRVTVQALCGRGISPALPTPHKTVFVRRGETKTAIASCRKGQFLFSGGFQRTNFGSRGGGVFPTESRAIGPRAWRVTGHAFGDLNGGELTAIAYCVRNKRPLLTEVSASTPLPSGQFATATTSPCPPGRRLTAGGFSANGSQDAFFADGSFNPDGSWSASGFGFFGPAPNLTAYGYCLRAKGS